ncbi:MAG: transcriptional repressor [Lachnospiraceae bacterium]|nr:transcriptional repressor [Lachnospiraceae bacterium]
MRNYKTVHRNTIYNLLKANQDRTFTVAQISDYLTQKGESINNSTIYRYLNKLVSEKQLNKYSSKNGTVYQFVGDDSDCHHHIHLKCMRCGAVIHLDCHFMHEMMEHIEKDHSFTLSCENSILYGLCDKCKQEQMNEDNNNNK